jgi:hypothetical protein
MNAPDSKRHFDLIDLDEDHAKGLAFNMLFMIWRRRTLATAYTRGMQLVRELGQKYPEGVGVLQVVEVDAIPPDSSARAAFVDFFHLKEIKHSSLTHEGSGFKAASVRAIAAAAFAVARAKSAYSVHSTLLSAAEWHEKRQIELGHREDATRIESIAQALRRLHWEKYPGFR